MSCPLSSLQTRAAVAECWLRKSTTSCSTSVVPRNSSRPLTVADVVRPYPAGASDGSNATTALSAPACSLPGVFEAAGGPPAAAICRPASSSTNGTGSRLLALSVVRVKMKMCSRAAKIREAKPSPNVMPVGTIHAASSSEGSAETLKSGLSAENTWNSERTPGGSVTGKASRSSRAWSLANERVSESRLPGFSPTTAKPEPTSDKSTSLAGGTANTEPPPAMTLATRTAPHNLAAKRAALTARTLRLRARLLVPFAALS